MERKTEHCCSADNAVERWCIIANALDLVQRLGITHTHTHACTLARTHSRTHARARAHTHMLRTAKTRTAA